MLNPCRPCVCPKAPCEQCMFGYRPAEENHEHMKNLILAVNAGEKPYGYICAERYMIYHENWNDELKGEKNMKNTRTTIFGGYGVNVNKEPSPDDRPNDGYGHLEYGIRRSFEAAIALNEPLFTTSAANLYDIFLANIPEEGRQHYTCNACRNFVDRFGGIVTLTDSGIMLPAMWNFKCPEFFEKAYYAVREAVMKSKVTGVFVTSEKKLGIPRTGIWTHMSVEVPKKIIYKNRLKTAFQESAEKKEDFKMLMRALQNYKLSTVETAVNVLRSNSLYRGEKTLGIAEWFMEIKKEFENCKRPGTPNISNIVWKKVATAPTGFCHVSNSMIGTLLDDIEEGYEFDEIKRRFDEKMNPTKYQRSQAAPSVGNVKRAEEIIAKLGLEKALERRYARLDEINTIWRPKTNKTNDISTGIFAGIKTKESVQEKDPFVIPKVTKMTWNKFQRTVLPLANKIELKTKYGNDSYAAIVTAEHPDAPPIILWDNEESRNPFSWYLYSGGSSANRWGLLANNYVEVTAIANQPNMGCEPYDYTGKGVFFILKNCKDINGSSSLALFPEVLRRDLREVRSTIEAYSRMHKLGGCDSASACGVLLQSAVDEWNCRLRVTTDVGVTEYILDRWD